MLWAFIIPDTSTGVQQVSIKSPQHFTLPSVRRAHECMVPRAMRVASAPNGRRATSETPRRLRRRILVRRIGRASFHIHEGGTTMTEAVSKNTLFDVSFISTRFSDEPIYVTTDNVSRVADADADAQPHI